MIRHLTDHQCCGSGIGTVPMLGSKTIVYAHMIAANNAWGQHRLGLSQARARVTSVLSKFDTAAWLQLLALIDSQFLLKGLDPLTVEQEVRCVRQRLCLCPTRVLHPRSLNINNRNKQKHLGLDADFNDPPCHKSASYSCSLKIYTDCRRNTLGRRHKHCVPPEHRPS